VGVLVSMGLEEGECTKLADDVSSIGGCALEGAPGLAEVDGVASEGLETPGGLDIEGGEVATLVAGLAAVPTLSVADDDDDDDSPAAAAEAFEAEPTLVACSIAATMIDVTVCGVRDGS